MSSVFAAAAEFGVAIPADRQILFERYLSLIAAWRPRVRLTGVGTPEGAARLVAGAFCVLPFAPESGRLIDLGTGAGVPGIPVAIVRPGLKVTLVDAVRKKAAFLEVAAGELALGNVRIVHGRAEALGRDAAHREGYEAATARAVAPVRVLAEYALPLLRIGGVAVLPKGRGAEDEVRAAARALSVLGGEASLHPARAGFCSPIVVLRKIAPTPPEYPRRSGVPARKPL